MQDPPATIIEGGIRAIRDYLYYNVQYEYAGGSSAGMGELAPPRARKRIQQPLTVYEPVVCMCVCMCIHMYAL
jgi:hypothetical protein